MDANSRQVIVKPSKHAAAATAAELLQGVVRRAVAERGQAFVALSGGTTPRAMYQILAEGSAADDVPWQAVHLFFGDERDVSHDDVESNYGMAQRTLLDYVPILPEHVHPRPADNAYLQRAAENYEQTIRRIVPPGPGGAPQLDLVMLGMGADGHTASLFPGTEVLRESHRLVRSYFVPVLGRNRMTFTYPLINAARNVVMLITGVDKAHAVAAMLGQEPWTHGDLPAGGVKPHGNLFILLDAEAGRADQEL